MSEKKKPPPPPPQPPPAEDEIRFGDELAVLPIRNAVLFPGAVAPFDVELVTLGKPGEEARAVSDRLYDDLRELGLDSLLAVELRNRLQGLLAVKVPVASVFALGASIRLTA